MSNQLTYQERRNLDVLVAEKIMGWKRVERWENLEPDTFYIDPTDGVYIAPNGHSAEPDSYRPTQNGAQAFEVLKKCERKLAGLGLISTYQPSVGGYWLRAVDDNQRHCEGIAEEKELAICLFAKQLFN